MIDNKQLEVILRIHGLSPASSDEELRSILVAAKYTEEEVNESINHLRKSKSEVVEDGLFKIVRTDSSLRPAEISALLGIDVTVEIQRDGLRRIEPTSPGYYFIVLATILFLAFFGIVFAMYQHEAGPFHASVSLLK